MKNKSVILLIFLIIVAVIAGLGWMVYKQQTDSKSKNIRKPKAPHELEAGIKTDIPIFEPLTSVNVTDITDSSNNPTKSKDYLTKLSVTEVYAKYLEYFTKNNYTISNKIENVNNASFLAKTKDSDVALSISKNSINGNVKVLFTSTKNK